MLKNKLKLISIFESIDGEVNGFHQGALTTFIRLAGCNLRCSYCDTTYSFTGGIDYTIESIVNSVRRLKPKKVTITGGEPLLQGTDLTPLIYALIDNENFVSIETNGTLPPLFFHDKLSWVYDYKLPSSKMEDRMNLENFKDLDKNDWVKFVINDDYDFERALEVRLLLDNIGCKAHMAYSSVFGIYPASKIVEGLLEKGKGDEILSLQLHKVIWPNCGALEER